MSVRTDVTVDWNVSPRVVTVASPSASITIQDLVDTLRDLEDELPNLGFDQIISAAGKEDLGGGVSVGITATLLNAVLAFEARSGPSYTQCSVSGGNLVAVDDVGASISPIQPTAFTQVLTTSSSSATLQDLTSIQQATYTAGQIVVDVINGAAGTEFPQGTFAAPCDNLADAITIAESRGLRTIYVIGSLTIGATDVLDEYVVTGQSPTNTFITLVSGASTEKTKFVNVDLTGDITGVVTLDSCHIDDVTGLGSTTAETTLHDCVIETGSIILDATSTQTILLLDCVSGVAGEATPALDMNGASSNVIIRNYSGGLELQNNTASNSMSFDWASGQVVLANSNTAGTLTLRGGIDKITDNSAGMTVNKQFQTQGLTKSQFLGLK